MLSRFRIEAKIFIIQCVCMPSFPVFQEGYKSQRAPGPGAKWLYSALACMSTFTWILTCGIHERLMSLKFQMSIIRWWAGELRIGLHILGHRQHYNLACVFGSLYLSNRQWPSRLNLRHRIEEKPIDIIVKCPSRTSIHQNWNSLHAWDCRKCQTLQSKKVQSSSQDWCQLV